MIRGRARVTVVAALLATALGAATAGADEPRLAPERIVLHTTMGDLVLALFPDVAPRHVEQILHLVRLGVYDGMFFFRIDPSFVAQLTNAQSRRRPLTAEQAAAIRPIPAEFSDLPHLRGTLSMARQESDPNSAETSFSILFVPAPHLDRRYTIFGRLEAGEEVLDAMATVPRDAENRPLQAIEVLRAEVADAAAIGHIVRRPLSQTEVGQSSASPMLAVARPPENAGRPAAPFLALVGVMMSCGIASFLLAGRAPIRVVGSLGLLSTLVGGFLIFTALAPASAATPLLAVALFAGMIALFKLMAWFESEPGARAARQGAPTDGPRRA